ncbi:uncharacterized protein HaLaN_32957, partial [Haematococcus lacustris]
LAVAHFSQESKIGRQLMTKCRALADENEEMGRELTEGKISAQESEGPGGGGDFVFGGRRPGGDMGPGGGPPHQNMGPPGG